MNALRTLRSRPGFPRPFLWALCLALLLPVAQLAASWHAMSHVGVEWGEAGKAKHALHVTHCDLCITAAVVGGGAPYGEPPRWVPAAVRHDMPHVVRVAFRAATRRHAYLSRAPPFASR